MTELTKEVAGNWRLVLIAKEFSVKLLVSGRLSWSLIFSTFHHSNTWLVSAPLSRQPYWMPRPIPKRKTQIGFAQNWLPCYCIVSVLLLSCYCIFSVLLMSCYCLVIVLSLYCYRALAFSGHQAVKVIEPEQIKLFANSLQLLLLINSSKT